MGRKDESEKVNLTSWAPVFSTKITFADSNWRPQIICEDFKKIVICLPTEHLGVHENSLKRVRAFQIVFGSAGFWGEGKTGVPETSRSKGENQQQWLRRRDLNPGHTGGRRVLSPLRHPCFP